MDVRNEGWGDVWSCVFLQENEIFIINNFHVQYKGQYIFSLKMKTDLIVIIQKF